MAGGKFWCVLCVCMLGPAVWICLFSGSLSFCFCFAANWSCKFSISFRNLSSSSCFCFCFRAVALRRSAILSLRRSKSAIPLSSSSLSSSWCISSEFNLMRPLQLLPATRSKSFPAMTKKSQISANVSQGKSHSSLIISTCSFSASVDDDAILVQCGCERCGVMPFTFGTWEQLPWYVEIPQLVCSVFTNSQDTTVAGSPPCSWWWNLEEECDSRRLLLLEEVHPCCTHPGRAPKM